MPNRETKIGLQDSELRKLLSFLINRSPISREQIAEGMNSSLRQPDFVSRRMLDDWTSECHKSARFPAFFIKAFCDAIGNDRLQRWAAGSRLLKHIELAELQLDFEERRVELLKPNAQRKRKGQRPRKS
ncbi:MAG: hypothetical protein ABSF14_18280 [Terriglobia bacterium]|jgi:hypothetical protein